MSSVYHLSVCFPYDTRNPIQMISESKGFRFFNLPQRINGNSYYVNLRKIEWCFKFIDENPTVQDSIIMFTDAHDVLVMGDVSDIVGRFLRNNCDILLSAEKLFSPWAEDEPAYRHDVRRYFETVVGGDAPYLNSGCWIGYGWAVRDLFKAALRYAEHHDGGSDQRVLQDILAKNLYPSHVNVKLDTNQEIFVSVIGNGDKLFWNGNRIFYENRKDPVPVFHANGYKRSMMFVKLYNELIYKTSSNYIDIRAIKNKGKYINIDEQGIFAHTENYCEKSLSAICKANRRFCLIRNNGEVITFNPYNNEVSSSKSLVDNWEIINLEDSHNFFSRFLGEACAITFEHHNLNNIWGFFKEDIHEDILRYCYNL